MTWILAFIFLVIIQQPIGIVVPHHNIVADERFQMMEVIKQKRFVTNKIVVLSPDHFSNDQKSIYYSDRNWEFPNSKIKYDTSFNNYVFSDLKLNDNLVKSDHGIYNILSDVGNVWPSAKVVPILIGQEVKFSNLDNFIQNLNNYCGFDCLLISSVDFSHYLPYKLANIHDQESISTLMNMNLDNPKLIEVDSPQSIYSLINFSKNKNANNFVLYNHTNSTELVENEDAESTSHVFGWYERILFGKSNKYNVKTFTYANNLLKKDNLNSLGERFFYGVGEINLNNKEINKNMIVAGYETDKEIKKVYFPLICKEKECIFARGEEKKKHLQQALDGVDNKDGEITITKN